MNLYLESLRQMLGAEPRRPAKEDFSEEARQAHAFKKTPQERERRRKLIAEELAEKHVSYKWRKWRWPSIILINLLFVISYHFDVQLVEGALTASRFVGFHMADLNSALQVTLAFKKMLINLVIGTATVFILWWLVGGRSFCAWACPYHLLSEWVEILHLKLAEKGWAKDYQLHRGVRTVLYVVFAALAFITGYTVFEWISPVGITSRALIYGTMGGMVWVAILLLIELFFIRRFWCRYMCPIGMTYAFVGSVSPTTIHYDLSKCLHEGECRSVCLVPHVLEVTVKGRATRPQIDIGADCTRCAMCLEACPTGALSFRIKGLDKLL